MKLLILGIDGGDYEVMKKLQLPFINGLFRDLETEEIREDLWSRGWSKLLSGLGGEETGAFYTAPNFDERKGLSFSQKFSSESYYEIDGKLPIWEKIQELGFSVGMMNFPTTAPAKAIANGFMVTGAGGGLSQKGVQKAPVAACSPSSIKKTLDQEGYIFDIRFRASGIRSTTVFLDNIKRMQERRTKSFLKLNEEYDVDVGAIAYMSVSRLQNLAMVDVLELANGNLDAIKSKILDVYRCLDRNLEEIVNKENPEAILLVSDHGCVVRKGTINLNSFLQRRKYLYKDSYFIEKAKYLFNRYISRRFWSNIQHRRSIAFSGRYINGVYICDEERFDGPVKEIDVRATRDKIIEEFNSDSLAVQYGLKASIYRENYSKARRQDLLPDIWIEKPDDLFFEARGEFVESNNVLGSIGEDLSGVRRDQYMGAKGSSPLFFFSKSMKVFIKETDCRDLTLGYKVVHRYLEDLRR